MFHVEHRRRWLALVLLLFAAPALAGECRYAVRKHERHTTRAQKREVYRRAGIAWEKRSCCVVDHVVPLELGGADEVSNMQIQTKAQGHAKDLVENFLAACVCRGETPLRTAQRLVVGWKYVTVGTCPREAP